MEDRTTLFSPVRVERKSTLVAEKIKSLILEKVYRPGERLPSENEWARRLSVSRASVREAFRALELMGLIEVRSGSGTYVRDEALLNLSKFSDPRLATLLEKEAETMLEIVEARSVFETNMITLAVEHGLPSDWDRLEGILSEMEEALDDEASFREADLRFHGEIARLTKNRVVETLVNAIYKILREHLPRAYYFVCSNPDLAKRLMKTHRDLVDSLRKQDKRRARAAMAQHTKLGYEISKAYLKDQMKEEGLLLRKNGNPDGNKEAKNHGKARNV